MSPLFETLFHFSTVGRTRTPECCNVTLARPWRDWTYIAILAGAVFLLLVTYDVWEYFSVTETVDVEASITTESVGPSADSIREELARFESLNSEHNLLRASALSLENPAK